MLWFVVGYLAIGLSAIWVAIDASRRDLSGLYFNTPAIWAVGVLIGWFLVLPAYLWVRRSAPRR